MPKVARTGRRLAALVSLLVIAAPLIVAPQIAAPLWASSVPQSRTTRPAAFAHAERLREALEGRPEQQRTRLQYERVLDAYRAIYHSDPASPKADASVAAVADLLAEEGRVFQDKKALHDAIGQFEFLRHQYPGSRHRFSALLTEGEIEQRDLGDAEQAKATYQTFLRLYPYNPLAEEAWTELRSMRREQSGGSRTSRGTRTAIRNPYAGTGRTTILTAASQSRKSQLPRTGYQESPTRQTPARRDETGADTAPRQQRAHRESAYGSSHIRESDLAPQPPAGEPSPYPRPASDRRVITSGFSRAASDLRMSAPPPPRRGRLPLITGIRHWSTPNYTRVAIDLQQEVRYQASRVPSPDRIFFDLYGTRLSPELVGRSVEVTDDGFLTHIRAAQFSGGVTRIVLDVHSLSDYSAFFLPNPPRLIIDVHGRKGGPPPLQLADRARSAIMRPARLLPPATVAHPENPSSSIHTGVFPAARVDSPLADVATLSDQPNQVRATRYPTTAPVMQSVAGTTPAPQPSYAQRTRSSFAKPSAAVPATDEVPPAKAGANGISAGQHVPTSMVRALGLKINRIVIDAGHGGHDSGTVSPGGVEEKDVVLDVALRLGRLLRQRLGADVIYTRTNDTFVPLETRTAIANQAQADLFISIHANSSPDTSARGVEVYYLNFTTSADALEVAARENAVSDESIHQLSDLVKKIALDDKISESRQFAADVDESLYAGLEPGNPGLKDRGVKKAPFVVLIGANMPSILAEISFLTNPEDAQELQESQYRQRIAEALYRGVARYVSSLNGVRLAQAASQPSGTE